MILENTAIIASDEVAKALTHKAPVVALESTVITHGMPYPQNLQMAQEVEAIVRNCGAAPATIAVLDGTLRVGLNDQELKRLAETGTKAIKASRKDLAFLIATRKTAGTTVAATMQIAAAVGIKVFATGGIGGAHRGAEETFDVSADLIEFASSPVAVICAGAKSILDLPKTLEILETHGVPVLGYRTDHFPAFYSRDSGLPVDYRVDDVGQIAEIIMAQARLGSPRGIVVANPISATDALDGIAIERRIAEATQEAKSKGVTGKQVTPFLLQRLVELTDGKSLAANIALIKNNATLAAHIAQALVATQSSAVAP
jgi:pseudouridine-5'-phosphate glycosidase